MRRAIILIFVCFAANAHAARFLFDADHGESAGNADWVIDADLHNLSWTSAGTFTTSSGNESNAQRIPTPPASGIAPGTNETYWSGAISAWAVDLVKRGHSVETLPAGATLTYNTANAQDLTNYDVVVIDEPNILFTNTEKQALLNFVANGGSLFMISDHVVSDRNGDGQDSVSIWNDFLTNNGLTNNPFGITFRTTGTGSNESGNNTFNHSIVGNPILNGPVGMATNMAYFNGNEFQIDTTKNPTVISQMWFGLSSDSNNFCGLANLQYGNGRVVVCGDSSCIDDGTGDPNDTSLFDGYTTDAGGVQHIWILNASEWLAAHPGPTNTWANSVSGKWEISTNWSSGTPSSADALDFITNATTKTVTIDAVTTNTPSSLTISNLTVSGPPGTVNTLQLTNAGVATPLTILSAATIGSGGALLVTNSAMRVASGLALGTLTVQSGGTLAAVGPVTIGGPNFTGSVFIVGGQFVVTNTPSTVGAGSGFVIDGSVTITNGSSITTSNDTVVGNAGSGNQLLVNTGGKVIDTFGSVGFNASSSNNVAVVTGTGSVWSNRFDVIVGELGSGNQLIVTNGGTVFSANGRLGDFPSTSNNVAVVTGTGSVWSNTDSLIVGDTGSGNQLLVANGGKVVSLGGTVGGDLSAGNNVALVSGPGSVWYNNGDLYVGLSGAGNQLIVTNGGAVFDTAGVLGTWGTNTSVRVVDNATWDNRGPLFVGDRGSSNTLIIAGGSVTAANAVIGLNAESCDHLVQLDSGSIFVTNTTGTGVFEVRYGKLIVNGGTLLVDRFVMTNACASFIQTGGTFITTGPAQVDRGVQTVAGGTTVFSSNLFVGGTAGATGAVIVSAGSLIVNTGVLALGNAGTTTGSGGVGSMTISNAEVTADSVLLGSSGGGQGFIAARTGGRLNVRYKLATNDGLLDGGTIDGSNATLSVGENHVANMTISNGVATFQIADVGFNNTGSLTMPGGSMTVLSNLVVGGCGAGVTGIVTITGGSLFVTNAAHDAVLEVRGGTVQLASGTLYVDRLVMTNACGHFVRAGGTLSITSTNLDPNLSAVGDGIPNGWKQQYRLDPFDPNLGSEDSDGDGMSNLQEFLAGTDPTNSAAYFHITSVVNTGNNVLVSWMTGPGKTNALQATAGAGDGSYQTNGFVTIFAVTNAAGSTTNYLDSGGATNSPFRYYRVRLVP